MAPDVLTLQAVADMVGGTLHGDGSATVSGVAAIDTAGGSELTFAFDEKNAQRLSACKAAGALVFAALQDATMPVVVVEKVEAALARVLEHFAAPPDLPPVGIDPSAKVADDASVDATTAIGPGVIIGSGARVEGHCALGAHVVVGRNVRIAEAARIGAGTVILHDTQIGARVRIGPNCAIGKDGFGYHTTDDGIHHPIPHAGNVVIEDDVHLGACVCVDRAKFGSTRIGAGSRVDNLVQIAHNVQIGKGCILCGQVGLAGSCRLGDFVVLGGSVGVKDNVTVGDGVQSAAFSAIAQDIEPGQIVSGIPAHNAREHFREVQAARKLPELLKQIRQIEARLKTLESPEDH